MPTFFLIEYTFSLVVYTPIEAARIIMILLVKEFSFYTTCFNISFTRRFPKQPNPKISQKNEQIHIDWKPIHFQRNFNKSEWVIVVYNFSAISSQEQVNFQWDDDEVRFVLDQHAYLDFYSASSLKQQSADRHVAPLRHIILIPSQPVFALSP